MDNNKETQELHVGKMIEAYLNENKIPKVKFAELISCSRGNVYNILGSPSINTQMLQHICYVLQHDFFSDISKKHIRV